MKQSDRIYKNSTQDRTQEEKLEMNFECIGEQGLLRTIRTLNAPRIFIQVSPGERDETTHRLTLVLYSVWSSYLVQ